MNKKNYPGPRTPTITHVTPPTHPSTHPPTLEASTQPTKNSWSSKNCTQLNYLPSDVLHNIGMWHAGLVYSNKIKSVLVQLTQHHPILSTYTSYKSKKIRYIHNLCAVICTGFVRLYILIIVFLVVIWINKKRNVTDRINSQSAHIFRQ